MIEITAETRRESYIMRPVNRKDAILMCLKTDGKMTASQIAYKLGYFHRSAVAPRLTELKSEGKVRAVSKAFNPTTGMPEAVWEVVK